MMDRDAVAKLIEDDPRYFYRVIKRVSPSFHADVQARYPSLDFVQSLYIWLYELPSPPGCPGCGKNLRFNGMRDGYSKFCSTKCAANDPAVKQAKADTNDARYGGGALRTPAVRGRFQQTMMERYGADHPLRVDDIKKRAHDVSPETRKQSRVKAEATSVLRFGVPNAAQHPEVQAKRRATTLQKYGVDTPLRDRAFIEKRQDDRRERFLNRLRDRPEQAGLVPWFQSPNHVAKTHPWACRACDTHFEAHIDNGCLPRCPSCFEAAGSVGQSQIRDFLRELGCNVQVGFKTLIAPTEDVIVLPDHRIAIEYNGLYWDSEIKVGRNYYRDKTNACEAAGLQLIHIFESEWLVRRPIVESRLKALLGKSRRVAARRCEIVRPSHREYAAFMEVNHIQGARNAKHIFALRHEGQFVAMMSFGKPRYDPHHEWEMLRYCSLVGVSVVGGAGRLLKAFEREVTPNGLVSYADRRWSTGGLYRTLGFTMKHASAPDYFYTKDGIRLESRLAYQKHKLGKLPTFDAALSEAENMQLAGYQRIFDSGSLVFEKRYV
jgi:hypothetical protein